MPGNYRQGLNTPRRAEPSIQFIRGIKSKDKPSFENLLNCATDNLCQSVRHATVVCFNNWSRYMSRLPQYLLKHYILYHDLVATVIIVLSQSVKKTRGHQRTLDCVIVSATSGELIAETNICCPRFKVLFTSYFQRRTGESRSDGKSSRSQDWGEPDLHNPGFKKGGEK